LQRLSQLGDGNTIKLEMFLIQVRVGEGYLNRDIWAKADEQIVSQEARGLLEENGFRIGKMGGILPSQFQSLLASERSCPNPRRLTLHAGTSTTLQLWSHPAPCSCQIHQHGQVTDVSLETAEGTLVMVASSTPDGLTRLRFTPEIHHGVCRQLPRPTKDRSGWIFQSQQPSEHYEFLTTEVTLAADEWVIIGGRLEHPNTVGQLCFIESEENAPRQRLLVIRPVGGSIAYEADDFPSDGGEAEESSQATPLAFQASLVFRR
jgi:hypothetical protein